MEFRILASALALTLVLGVQSIFASEQILEDQTFQETNFPALAHFEEDKSIINECLSEVPSAELHFYWTTGRDINPDYGASLHIDVGGAKYARKFPRYVSELLSVAPDNLKVKFVCDEMTRASNSEWIGTLQDLYGERFEILDSGDIHANILNGLNERKDLINLVFKNAIAGNPAIASDIYRLIGMPLGRDLPSETILQTQYTYCDVDAFCSGMETPNEKVKIYFDPDSQSIKQRLDVANGHTNLVKALFSKPNPKKPVQRKPSLFVDSVFDPTTTFYLGRRKEYEGNSNDLIKLRIINLSEYKIFCSAALSKMSAINSKKKKQDNLGVLSYFSVLHSYIKECEEEADASFQRYIDEFSNASLQIADIIHVTGPGLADNLRECLSLDQEYPRASAWEWHGTQLISQGRGALESVDYNDEDGLRFIMVNPEDAVVRVSREFEQYALRVSDAFFAKRFGSNHPFNVKLVDYLRTHFPYATASFKSLMAETCAYKKEKMKQHPGFDEVQWLDYQLNLLTKRPQIQSEVNVDDPYYVRLNHILQQLGIDISLTREMIDFRV